MKITIQPSAAGGGPQQFLTTVLIDGRIAIDAGCLGFHGEPRGQVKVRHVFLTHSHADHVCSLPLFVTHVTDCEAPPVTIYGSAPTLESVRDDIFNGRAWPVLDRMVSNGTQRVRLAVLAPEQTVAVDGYRVTAVPVDHVLGTFGYIVDDGRTAVALSSDSRATDAIWRIASAIPHLKAAFIGVAFPDARKDLAELAGHMTPASFAREAAKLPPTVAIVVLHMKPVYHAQIVEELERLGLANVTAGASGESYEF